MKGSLHKKYDFSSIITIDDLKYLSSLILPKFNFVKYHIETKDGARYDINSLDEILQYDNYDDRKIELLSIRANFLSNNSFVYPNIKITLYDNSIYEASCILDINDLEECEIIYYSKKIEEFTKRIRASYWWCHKQTFYNICGILLYFLFALIYIYNTDNNENYNKVYNFLVLQGWAGICMVTTMSFGKRVILYLFPKACFCIGMQKKFLDCKIKCRNFLFITILATIILGVISSIIAHLIIT